MGIERLERVMWRIRSTHPGKKTITNPQLRLAIMHECGTDPKTYRNNRAALKRLGWIKHKGRVYVQLTDKDISG